MPNIIPYTPLHTPLPQQNTEDVNAISLPKNKCPVNTQFRETILIAVQTYKNIMMHRQLADTNYYTHPAQKNRQEALQKLMYAVYNVPHPLDFWDAVFNIYDGLFRSSLPQLLHKLGQHKLDCSLLSQLLHTVLSVYSKDRLSTEIISLSHKNWSLFIADPQPLPQLGESAETEIETLKRMVQCLQTKLLEVVGQYEILAKQVAMTKPGTLLSIQP